MGPSPFNSRRLGVECQAKARDIHVPFNFVPFVVHYFTFDPQDLGNELVYHMKTLDQYFESKPLIEKKG